MMEMKNDWKPFFELESKKDYCLDLKKILEEEFDKHKVYPSLDNILTAFKLTSYENTKVVIIGQDPYHEPNQAHGLAFSVLDGVKLPPSLKNIYKEIENEFGYKMSNSGNLEKWANQGVLLLNNVLTVREGNANSHKGIGWEKFTDNVIKYLNERKDPIIFVFWGNNAKNKLKLITKEWHYVFTAPHPSPLSAYHGFFGCNHFLKINEILCTLGKKEIDWKI